MQSVVGCRSLLEAALQLTRCALMGLCLPEILHQQWAAPAQAPPGSPLCCGPCRSAALAKSAVGSALAGRCQAEAEQNPQEASCLWVPDQAHALRLRLLLQHVRL